MLAAIFEDEGVALPTTQVKSTQVREWVQQVRQSRRLSGLQAEMDGISKQVDHLTSTERALWQLQPLLLKDASQLERSCADQSAAIQDAKRKVALQEEAYQSQRHTLNSSHSQAASQLRQVETDLDNIEQR